MCLFYFLPFNFFNFTTCLSENTEIFPNKNNEGLVMSATSRSLLNVTVKRLDFKKSKTRFQSFVFLCQVQCVSLGFA